MSTASKEPTTTTTTTTSEGEEQPRAQAPDADLPDSHEWVRQTMSEVYDDGGQAAAEPEDVIPAEIRKRMLREEQEAGAAGAGGAAAAKDAAPEPEEEDLGARPGEEDEGDAGSGDDEALLGSDSEGDGAKKEVQPAVVPAASVRAQQLALRIVRALSVVLGLSLFVYALVTFVVHFVLRL